MNEDSPFVNSKIEVQAPIFRRKAPNQCSTPIVLIFCSIFILTFFLSGGGRPAQPIHPQTPPDVLQKMRRNRGKTTGRWSPYTPNLDSDEMRTNYFGLCSYQYELCECDGVVRFGKGQFWTYREGSGTIVCMTEEFGHEPISGGVNKECQCKSREDMKTEIISREAENNDNEEDAGEAEEETPLVSLEEVFVFCAHDNKDGSEKCNCDGVVRYGAEQAWIYRMNSGSIECSQRTFLRNPRPRKKKECQCLSQAYTLNKDVVEEIRTEKLPCQDSDGIIGYNFTHKGFWRPFDSPEDTASNDACSEKCEFDASCFAFSRNQDNGQCYTYTSKVLDKNKKQVAKSNLAYKRCKNAYNSFIPQNLIFIRPKKVGSSTFSGVVRRIGAHYGLSGFKAQYWTFDHEPGLWANHELRPRLSKRLNRLTQHKYFITLVRDPIPRCLSYINHVLVSRGERNMTAEQKIKTFKSNSMKPKDEGCFGHYKKTLDPDNQDYDFIGITERFDESLIVLKNILHLNYNDILYLSAKVAGHKDEYGFQISRYKSFEEEDQELRDFVDSEWRFTNPDFWIYRNAVERLNASIAAIPNFDKQLRVFEEMLIKAQEACSGFYLKDCYFSDHGCGHTCLDMQILEKT